MLDSLTMETAMCVPTSPLLRGGHALTRRVHEMFIERKSPESELVKRISEKLSTSHSNNTVKPLCSFDGANIWQNIIETPAQNGYKAPRMAGLTPSTKSDSKMEKDHTEVHMLRATVTKHEKRLDEMQQTVMRLEEDSVRSHRRMTHVRRKVAHHETVFQDTLTQTQRALQQHADLLVKQQHVAQIIMKERRQGQDIMFDTGFLMLSMYIVQTPLVQYTIHIVTSRWIRTTRNHNGWLLRALQVAYIFHVYHILKYLNIKLGLSSKFWSGTKWTSNKIKNIGWYFTKIFTHRGSVLNSSAVPNSITSTNRQNTTQNVDPTPLQLSGAVVRGISLKGGRTHRPNNLVLS